MYIVFLKYVTAFGTNPDPYGNGGNAEILEMAGMAVDWSVSSISTISTIRQFSHPIRKKFKYTREEDNQLISTYCLPTLGELTGVQGDDIELAPYFSTSVKNFENWVSTCGSGSTPTFVTMGRSDTEFTIQRNYINNELPFPSTFYYNFIDFEKEFSKITKKAANDVARMNQFLSTPFTGYVIGGWDTVRTMSSIMSTLIVRGMTQSTVTYQSSIYKPYKKNYPFPSDEQ